jgi:predicted transcriptional regulator
MTQRAILLTIKSVYAEEIPDGEKPEEYRTRPPRISNPTRTIMYVSGLRHLIGEFTMEPVSGERTSLGYPLPVRNPIPYKPPIPWESVRRAIPGIRRPQQSFRYLDPADAADARLLEMLEPHRISGR